MASPVTERRPARVTAVAAAGLREKSWLGSMSPYMEVSIDDGLRARTAPDDGGDTNPVWDESFMLELPPEAPEAPAPRLRVAIYAAGGVMPRALVGRGEADLSPVLATGGGRVSVDLFGKSGRSAGRAFLNIEIPPSEAAAPIASAAGAVLGEGAKAPHGLAAASDAGPSALPTLGVGGPATPLVGAVAPGGLEDPCSPAYGLLH